MKKVRIAFLAVALIAIFSAFVTKKHSNLTNVKYVGVSIVSDRYYIADDPTTTSIIDPYDIPLSYNNGDEYDCTAGNLCTFEVNSTEDGEKLFDENLDLYYFDTDNTTIQTSELGSFDLN